MNKDFGRAKIARDLMDRKRYYVNNIAAANALLMRSGPMSTEAQSLFDELMELRVREIERIEAELNRMGVVNEAN